MTKKIFDYSPRIYTSKQLENEIKELGKISKNMDFNLSEDGKAVNVMEMCQTVIDTAEKLSLSFRIIAEQYDEALNEVPLFLSEEETKEHLKKNKAPSKKFRKIALSNMNVSCSYNKGVLEVTLPYLHRSIRNIYSKSAWLENTSLADKTRAVLREFSNQNKIDLYGIYSKPLKIEIERHVFNEKRIPDLLNIGIEKTIDAIFSEIGRSDNYESLVELNYKTIKEENVSDIKTIIRLFEVD